MATRIAALVILLVLLNVESTDSESLWCYECNTNLGTGRSTECNDPYTTGPSMDLVHCGSRESHHCLKSVVLYQHVLVTIRSCVPSQKIDDYCYFPEYPDAIIDCHFCNDYACNGKNSITKLSFHYLKLLCFTLIIALKVM